jgi:hypothetical protein
MLFRARCCQEAVLAAIKDEWPGSFIIAIGYHPIFFIARTKIRVSSFGCAALQVVEIVNGKDEVGTAKSTRLARARPVYPTHSCQVRQVVIYFDVALVIIS